MRPLRKVKVPRALGAVAAQMTQALGSFALQVLAARELGAHGFGVYAFMLGSIVMGTALSTGLVGDSLTVLDRHRRSVRTALTIVGITVVQAAAVIAFVGGIAFGQLSWQVSLAFAGAMALFMAEDLGRRVLMADLHFWSLVTVDTVSASGALGTVGLLAVLGELSLSSFLVAIIVGQVAGGLVTVFLVRRRQVPDPADKSRADQIPSDKVAGDSPVRADIRAVLGFGVWRAAQQFVRPTMLNLARFVVIIALTAAAVGELEAARVFVAPAMLLVQGVGYYLFASYAKGKSLPLRSLLDRADRAAFALLTSALVVGGMITALEPLFGDLITGGGFELHLVAIFGWVVYAASCAAVMPYGSLATVRGKQAPFLAFRVLDSLTSVGLVALGLVVLSVPVEWVPWLLSVGSFAGGFFCRNLLLLPMTHTDGGLGSANEPAAEPSTNQ